MKKLLSAIIITLTIVLSLFAGSTPSAYAADKDSLYEQTLKVVAVERTDVYAIDYYKYGPRKYDKEYVKWANKITNGIDDDYEKARAIFNWVVENTIYGFTVIDLEDFEKYGYMEMTCEGYASTTQGLLNAAGLPAKKPVQVE